MCMYIFVFWTVKNIMKTEHLLYCVVFSIWLRCTHLGDLFQSNVCLFEYTNLNYSCLLQNDLLFIIYRLYTIKVYSWELDLCEIDHRWTICECSKWHNKDSKLGEQCQVHQTLLQKKPDGYKTCTHDHAQTFSKMSD
jgi:hypothetical protein